MNWSAGRGRRRDSGQLLPDQKQTATAGRYGENQRVQGKQKDHRIQLSSPEFHPQVLKRCHLQTIKFKFCAII